MARPVSSLSPRSPIWLAVALLAASVAATGAPGDGSAGSTAVAGERPAMLEGEPVTAGPSPASIVDPVAAFGLWQPSPVEPSPSVVADRDPQVATAAGEAAVERRSGRVGEPVTIAFGGDIHFEGQLAAALADDPRTVLDPVAELVADADLAVANLETAVTIRGTPAPKQFTFRTGPEAFIALRDAGIDVVSMANNHGMDYGPVGLQDSLAHATVAGFPVVGIGLDAEGAFAPWSTEINGQRIAVIGATQVLDSSLIEQWTATDERPGLASAKEVDRLVTAVADARAQHDTVIVYLHWGVEGQTCPAPRQLELSDRLIDAGADVIVGGHAHRLQGGGRKGGALVHYGLGNFVFYADGGAGADSGVLLVTVAGRTIERYEWIPARLQAGVATRIDPEQEQAAVEAWEQLRSCTDLVP